MRCPPAPDPSPTTTVEGSGAGDPATGLERKREGPWLEDRSEQEEGELKVVDEEDQRRKRIG